MEVGSQKIQTVESEIITKEMYLEYLESTRKDNPPKEDSNDFFSSSEFDLHRYSLYAEARHSSQDKRKSIYFEKMDESEKKKVPFPYEELLQHLLSVCPNGVTKECLSKFMFELYNHVLSIRGLSKEEITRRTKNYPKFKEYNEEGYVPISSNMMAVWAANEIPLRLSEKQFLFLSLGSLMGGIISSIYEKKGRFYSRKRELSETQIRSVRAVFRKREFANKDTVRSNKIREFLTEKGILTKRTSYSTFTMECIHYEVNFSFNGSSIILPAAGNT